MRKGEQDAAPRRTPATFRRQLFLLLAIFIAVVLVILWVFQIFLLGPMYETLKQGELRRVSQVLSDSVNLNREDLQSLSDRMAKQTNICVSVYEIVRQHATEVVSSHIQSSCMIHNVNSNEMMNRLYYGALENGYHTERITGNFFYAGMKETENETVPESIMASALSESSGGRSYLILLNTEIEPVGTTRNTLMHQLVIISVILLLAASLIAFFASSKMSRPIAQMSREAQKLALGNYDVHFDGGASREMAELGDALNYAARELSALDTMQKELLANISHDLRTPLTMISGYSEVMRDIPGEMTPENMQIIIDESRRLSALVNDILELSRLKSGAPVLHCETFSLTQAVRETMHRYHTLCAHDGYVLDFTCTEEVHIYGDRSKILQVLYNLVNNAVNYTGEDKKVTVRQRCTDGMCRIEVTDTGEGIPAEQLPLIWDRYYKSNHYRKRSVSGSGIGLSIVKSILLLHGARFGVQSEVGRGSTFWFELPSVPAGEKGPGERP